MTRPSIDVHAHIGSLDAIAEMNRVYPAGVPRVVEKEDGFYYHWESGAVNGPVPPGMFDPASRLADMDATGVDRQVVSVRPPLIPYSVPADLAGTLFGLQNEGVMAQVDRHEGRMDAFITLPLQATDQALAEIERWAPDRRVRGAMIDSNIDGRNLDDPAFHPIWAALEAADLPVLIHPYKDLVAGYERLTRYYLANTIGNPVDTTIAIASIMFGGLLDRFPKLRWCFVHGGGVAPYLLGRWDRGWTVRPGAKEHLTRAPSTYFDRLFFDTVVHQQPALRFLAELVGWEQIVLGSDYPFDMGDPDPVRFVQSLDLPPDQEEAVLAGNAPRFLRPS